MRRKFKESVVQIMNDFDGWELKLGREYATGKTPKGLKCIMAFDMGTKPNIKKEVLEYLKKKEDLVQLFMFFHPRGNYLFWLNDINFEDKDLTLNPNDASSVHLAY